MDLLDEVRSNLPVLRGIRQQAYMTAPRMIDAESINDNAKLQGTMK
jgi:hypothetical protein